MPYQSTWVEPKELFYHMGVTVYHAYKDQEADQILEYHFAVGTEDDMLSENLIDFDVRELSTFQDDFASAMIHAIDNGELTEEGISR